MAETVSAAAQAPRAPDLESQAMRIPKSASEHAVPEDRYYGHRIMSEVAERMLMDMFACSRDSMSASVETSSANAADTPRLSYFVAYALYRTKLPMAVMYTALLLLKRLKMRYPVARGSSGHRLFISAYMLACKTLCDDSYNNKSWVIVGQNLFTLREINQMERELFGYLDLHLQVLPEEMVQFAAELEKYGAPPVTLEDLKRTRFSVPSAGPSAPRTPPRNVSGSHTRRKSHRRCLSLKPDYWAHPSAAVSAAATTRHHRSESSEWSATGMQRSARAHLRSSMPAQRSVPVALGSAATTLPYTPTYTHRSEPHASPSHPLWSVFYTSNNASTLSMATPNSMASSLRPTPSTSLSELSLNSPPSGLYVPAPSMSGYYGLEPPVKQVPAYEINESFRMPPLPSAMPP
ncbi:hypothetical protein MCAP1_003270 [Malassezia caprae]|uniref:Cyclin-like domain-containing protein n=1 Tax=Malassezia caprae TaxID=1381934 RepID=A0AAF0E8P7_9BASI|nr:hypothetical protein MCAP1_003270 [Malassezia caprae]